VTEPARDRLAAWRADTPGTAQRIHLNNAGAALMPLPVVQAVTEHLNAEVALGGYEAADIAGPAVDAAYDAVAGLVGARRRNIAVVENATAAMAQALASFDLGPGDIVVTSNADYVSNQLMLMALRDRRGVAIARAADLPQGGVDAADVRRLLGDDRVKLVVMSWIPTNSGMVQDVAAVGEACLARGIPFILDGCQAIGQLSIDAPALGCDFLAATGRKFLRGPRGVGFLFVSDRALDAGWYPLSIDLRGATWTDPDRFELASDARRFENWEFATGLVLGLGAAARYALDAGAEALTRTAWLADRLRERLGGIPAVHRLDRGSTQSGIVTVDLRRDPYPILRALRATGINTSAFTRSAAVIDMDRKGVRAGLRLSPHYYNTLDEVDRAVDTLASLLAQ